jgi:hypothetical protein
MNEEEIKILTKDNEVITLKELFERKERARKEMANIPFEEKIRILVQLQKIALTWGEKKNVFVWDYKDEKK